MNAQDIRKLMEQDKLVIGYNETLRLVRDGACEKVLVAENAEKSRVESMTHYCELSSLDCEVLDLRNNQLGTACRKPFPISFLAVK